MTKLIGRILRLLAKLFLPAAFFMKKNVVTYKILAFKCTQNLDSRE